MADQEVLSAQIDTDKERLPFFDKVKGADSYVYLLVLPALGWGACIAIWWQRSNGDLMKFLYNSGHPGPLLSGDDHREIEKIMMSESVPLPTAVARFMERNSARIQQGHQERLRQMEPSVCEERRVTSREFGKIMASFEKCKFISDPDATELMAEESFRVVGLTPAGEQRDFILSHTSERERELLKQLHKFSKRLW